MIVPSCIEERNKKDKLYNSIIQYLEKEGLYWKSDKDISSGTNFVKSLCKILWYIDGHYSIVDIRLLHVSKSSKVTIFQNYQNIINVL